MYNSGDAAEQVVRMSLEGAEVPLAELLLFSEIGADGWDFSAAPVKGAFFSAAGFSACAFSFWAGFSISSSRSLSSSLFSGAENHQAPTAKAQKEIKIEREVICDE